MQLRYYWCGLRRACGAVITDILERSLSAQELVEGFEIFEQLILPTITLYASLAELKERLDFYFKI